MPLSVRKLTEEDYPTLVEWWKGWKWDPVPVDFLPDNGTGGAMVIDADGDPICAGFVYSTNSKVAWVDWIISSHQYKGDDRGQALDLLIATLSEYCKIMGAKYIYALLKHKGLVDRYKKFGFHKADTYNTEMIKTL